jgi:hypothetical protein
MAIRRPGSLRAWRRQAVRRLTAVRQSTLAFVARVPEPEVARPRSRGGWSIKDVLAHLMSCDEETVRRLRLIARGRGDRIYWFRSMADADRFNARTVDRARRLRLPALLRRMARARADLIDRLERLPPAALRDPSHEYAVTQWLPTSGWTHERDHVSELRAWWRGQRAARAGRAARRRNASPSKLR